MTNTSIAQIKAMLQQFEKAYNEYQDAEKRLLYEQEQYARIGQEYLASNPYEANHELIEYQRGARDAASAECNARGIEYRNLSDSLLSKLVSLTGQQCAGNDALRRIYGKAVSVHKGQSLLQAIKTLILLCLLAVGWFAFKSVFLYAVISFLAALSLLFLRSYVKFRSDELSEALWTEVLHYVREGTGSGAPRSGNDSQRAEEVSQDEDRPESSDAALLETRQYRQFEEKFRASLELKDCASLASALRVRREGTELVRDVPALYCVGKHNEMILEYNHIGLGIEARQSALESLKHEGEFKSISLALSKMFNSNFYAESLEYLTFASTSYEEAMEYSGKLRDQFPTEANKRRDVEIKELRSKQGRWYSAHRAILNTFYSRVNADLDKGRYAGGISLIDIILTNSQNTGYSLDYEEYVDLLDDMCALAVQLLMQKTSIRHQLHIHKDEAEELGCIMQKPIKYLTNFYPECLPKDKVLFNNHYESWKLIPWISDVSGWNELRSLIA